MKIEVSRTLNKCYSKSEPINIIRSKAILLAIIAITVLLTTFLIGSNSFATGSGVISYDNIVSDESIVAIVNGDIISVDDFITLAKIYNADLGDKDQRNEILQNLINDKVAVQLAEKNGIIITEGDVEKDIDKMVKENFNSDRKKLEMQLENAGFTIDDYRWFKKTELAKTKLQEKFLSVSDTETKKYFNDNRKKLGYMIEASHILVSTEKKAKDIIKQIKKGANFGKLATQKSIEPAAKQTKGYLGWFIKGMMVPEFEKAAFKIKVGHISSKPVETQFGYHIIKIHKKKLVEYKKIKSRLKDIIIQKKYKDFSNMIAKSIKEAKVEKRIGNIPTSLNI